MESTLTKFTEEMKLEECINSIFSASHYCNDVPNKTKSLSGEKAENKAFDRSPTVFERYIVPVARAGKGKRTRMNKDKILDRKNGILPDGQKGLTQEISTIKITTKNLDECARLAAFIRMQLGEPLSNSRVFANTDTKEYYTFLNYSSETISPILQQVNAFDPGA